MTDVEPLECDFCGRVVPDTEKDNAWFGVVPYPGDVPGRGMCRGCGGDPEARTARKRMGWVMAAFVDARIPILRDKLSSANQGHFDKMSYAKKASVVLRMVEKGLMV